MAINYEKLKRQAGIGVSDQKPKTAEEEYKEQHKEERQKAQDTVDAVLSSSSSTRDYLTGGSSRQSSVVSIPDIPKKVNQDTKQKEVIVPPKKKTTVKTVNSSDYHSSIEDDIAAFNDDIDTNIQVALPDDGVVESRPNRVEVLDIDYQGESESDREDDADEEEQESEEVSAKKSQSRPARRSTAKQSDDQDIAYSRIKKFPTELAKHVRSLFPEANNMDEAITAYIYMNERYNIDTSKVNIPDRIEDIIDSYVGDQVNISNVQGNILDEIDLLRNATNNMANRLSAIELGIVYALFDRMGFRRKDQLSPGEIDFLESGINDLMNRLELQAEKQAIRRKNKEGRPKR